jgi:predicted ribosome-associated RNA-binding protein Tma20
LQLKIYVKYGVEQYIFKGADLMWPGIFKVDFGPGDINSFK